MAADDHMFRLRIPRALHERLQSEAKARGRSLNNEMLVRLESSFNDPTPDLGALGDLVRETIRQAAEDAVAEYQRYRDQEK